MNSIYGFCGVEKGFLPRMEVAASVTSVGRSMLQLSRDTILRVYDYTEVVYGDSVTGPSPIIVRYQGQVKVTTMERLAELLAKPWKPYRKIKEAIVPVEHLLDHRLDVLGPYGFTAVRRLIRHRTHKMIYRVTTGHGVVEVTEDHSLVTLDHQKITPLEVHKHHTTPLLHVATLPYTTATFPEVQPTRQPDCTWQCFPTQLEAQAYIAKHPIPASLSVMYHEAGSNWVIYPALKGNRRTLMRDRWAEWPGNGQYVYDLETEGGMFQAGCGRLVVSNTDSVMVRLKQNGAGVVACKDMDSVFQWGAQAAEVVTNLFKKPIMLEFEKVYKPYFLYSKKR